MEYVVQFDEFMFQIIANNNFEQYFELITNGTYNNPDYVNQYNIFKSIEPTYAPVYKKIDIKTS